MPLRKTSQDPGLVNLNRIDLVKTHLNAYLPASPITQSSSPVRSPSLHNSKILSIGPEKRCSSAFITSAPAATLTVRHSLTRAFIVQSVFSSTVEVVDEDDGVPRWDKQVRSGLRSS